MASARGVPLLDVSRTFDYAARPWNDAAGMWGVERVSGVLISFGLFACTGASADQLRARAAHDLACDEAKLTVSPIGESMQSVSGCNKKRTYIELCDGPKNDPTTRCTWIVDSLSIEDEPTQACTPNQTQACLGPGACSGAQACLADGTGYTACDCGAAPSGAAGAPATEPPATETPAPAGAIDLDALEEAPAKPAPAAPAAASAAATKK